jgi:hypothetical protein
MGARSVVTVLHPFSCAGKITQRPTIESAKSFRRLIKASALH